jgi:hypothetical protein
VDLPGYPFAMEDRLEDRGSTLPHGVDEPVPSSSEGQDELVDRASEDSFPASDAASYWQRGAVDRSEDTDEAASESGSDPSTKAS